MATRYFYSGNYFFDAIIAPRFIASAFVTGPAFLIVALRLISRLLRLAIPEGAIQTLTSILRVTVWVNLFLLASEVFTQFYTGGSHAASATYLYFGLEGHSELVPWIWTAIALNVTAACLLVAPATRHRNGVVIAACIFTFIGVWIEKGMGMIIPGFVPSTMHELVEYAPSLTEWKLTAGIWAMGIGIFTVSVKIAAHILTGRSGLGERRSR